MTDTNPEPNPGGASPWGVIDRAAKFHRDGQLMAVFVSAPSHGGFWLTTDAMAVLSAADRAQARPHAPWFEEDCAWCVPYLALRLGELDPNDDQGAFAQRIYDAFITPKRSIDATGFAPGPRGRPGSTKPSQHPTQALGPAYPGILDMTDYFATTVIRARIPLADITPLEQLFLGEIFTCDEDCVHASYFAPQAPASVVCPPHAALTQARWASAYTESRLNRFVIETLLRYGQIDTDVEIAVDRQLWETILQDIVRRSPTLPYVPVVTVYPAASPADWGQGGDASLITAGDVLSISTTRFLDDAIARFETGRAAAAA